MEKELESHQQMNLLKDLELPLARILSKMEEIGIYTDVNDLQRMQQELQEKLELLVQRIHDAQVKHLTLIRLNNSVLFYLKH